MTWYALSTNPFYEPIVTKKKAFKILTGSSTENEGFHQHDDIINQVDDIINQIDDLLCHTYISFHKYDISVFLC